MTAPAALAATAMRLNHPGTAHEPVAVLDIALAADDVLVAIELATICGSDVHTVLGHRTEPTPLVLGHEAVGRVVAVGAGGAHASDGTALAAGDRVVWSVAVHCGACDRCARGLTQKCRSLRKYGHERMTPEWQLSGGFATHAHLLAGTAIVRAPESVPAEVLAPAGCGIATAWAALAAVERTVPLSGASVLITGGGLIGLAACAMATSRGARATVSDPDATRRALAGRFGAHEVHEPTEKLLQTYDAVIDASGAPRAVSDGLDALDVGGAAAWVGSVFPTDPVAIVPERVVRGLITITGVHNYGPVDLEAAVRFLEASWGEYPFAELVGASFPLADLDRALERAAEHAEVRVGVVPGA